MKKLFCLLLAAFFVCAALTGCGASEKRKISFSTAATTGALYPLGAYMAGVWNDRMDGVAVSSQASGGGLDNLNLLRDGETDLGFAVTSIMYASYNGTDSFEGRENKKLRVVAGLYCNPNQIVAAPDSGIEDLSDIAGSRFAPGAPGSTTCVEAELHLTAAGVDYPDGFDAEFVGFTESIDLIRNRQLDGVWIMAGIPNAAVTEITSTAGGYLVPVDDAVAEKLKAEYPWYTSYTIPAGTYDGQNEDVQTTAIKLCLFTTSDMDADLVYGLTKTFWENIDETAAANRALAGVEMADAVTDLAGLPLHEGAERYYREQGLI